ncbi:MAG TPA: FecR family protein [Methylomirabilota bacterium]|nr:FecR family protein [Methylomirabilota bacterium]
MKTTTIRAFAGLLMLTISIPATAWSQERAGVATSVIGAVTVTRVAMPPAPLNFKDDVFMKDRIATGEKAFARVLLGGKAVVTAREHSVITITEAPGTSTIDLLTGRISVNVDKSKMRPGELVEIKTPNAVAGIRGTIVVADARRNRSTITVLRGLVDVYRRDPVTGNALGAPVPVGVRQSIVVNAGVLPARPQEISVDTANQLSTDFTPPVRVISPELTTNVNDEVIRARDLIGVLAPPTTSTTDAATVRDTLTNLGDDTSDKSAKADKADKLDRATDKLDRLSDRFDRAADRLGDKLDKGDKPDAGPTLERGPRAMPGGGPIVTTPVMAAPPVIAAPPTFAAPPVMPSAPIVGIQPGPTAPIFQPPSPSLTGPMNHPKFNKIK